MYERLVPPARPNAAERIVAALTEQHQRIAIDLGRDESKAPGWFAHLPGGTVFPIRLIGTWGPFVRFIGFGATADTVDYVLVAPESVVVQIRTLPQDEPKRPFMGFTGNDQANHETHPEP